MTNKEWLWETHRAINIIRTQFCERWVWCDECPLGVIDDNYCVRSLLEDKEADLKLAVEEEEEMD